MSATAQLLTPQGPGAVAVIELECRPDLITGLLSAFSADPPRDLASVAIGRIVYGQWRSEDVVLVRIGLQKWEIHCHGGIVAIDRILSDLETVGVQRRHVQMFDRDTMPNLTPLHETTDADIASHLEAVLIQCRTRKTAALALAQTDGRLLRLWRDLHAADVAVRRSAEEQYQKWKHVAEHLVRPWTVALVGAPNAGKSSLMNAIAGRERAIVSDMPGTTRDLLEAEVIVDGWPFLFVDSAGIREAAESSIEASGISRSRALAQTADVVCFVVDRTAPSMEWLSLNELEAANGRVCILLNKSDLLRENSILADVPFGSRSSATFEVSAVTSHGLSGFLEWLVRAVIPEEPSTDDCIPIFPSSALLKDENVSSQS